MEGIPVTETYQVPAKTMEINQSTAKGNADALNCLLDQAGVGNPKEKTHLNHIDMTPYVLLIHGNLATLEQVQSIQESRSLEGMLYCHYQYVIFILGLFHLKMACTNAIWHILIQPKDANLDPASWMQEFAILQPNETGKMMSNPAFCRLHEAIQHTGLAMWLDCWHTELVKWNHSHDSLEKFAESEPSWDIIMEISIKMVKKYVASEEYCKQYWQPPRQRDEVFENTLQRPILHAV